MGEDFAHFLRLEEFQLATLQSLGCCYIKVFCYGPIFFWFDLPAAIEKVSVARGGQMTFCIEPLGGMEVLQMTEAQAQKLNENVTFHSLLPGRN